MSKTIVISAFPACGKTYAFEHYQDRYKILDSDSSQFSWMQRNYTEEELAEKRKEWESTPHLLSSDGYINKIKNDKITVRNPDFPNNYIKHIKENLGKVDVIFVSSHLSVREAMTVAGIDFCTVYPYPEMLNEWVGRMFQRGDNQFFIKNQITKWNEFTKNIENEPHGKMLFRLGNNEYIDIDHILYVMETMGEEIEFCMME